MGMNTGQLVGIARHFVQAKQRWATLRGDALQEYQDQRARQIVAYAAMHSPFYRDHWAGHDLTDWRALPTIDKQAMMTNFGTFNTRGISRDAAMQVALRAEQSRNFAPTIGDVTVGLSSGTSGHRGIFLAAPWEQAGWAGVMLSRALHRVQGRLRVAFFLRSNSNLYEHIGGLLIQFRYFDLMTPLPDAIAALNTFQPQIIVGPPSLLNMLADARETGALRCRPDRLISVAEVLEPQDHARLHTVFQVAVHQIYQCTEGLLAISCARGSLHIQEDLVVMQGEAVEDGDHLTPIITDLWRRTQPIVRYRLNDVVQLAPQLCACGSGFRVIQTIEGRSDDCCRFIAANGGECIFFPDTIRRMILLASEQIADYQAVQERVGQLRIHLAVVPGANFDVVARAVRASVASTVAQYACRPAEVCIEDRLEPLAAGAKRRRVRCVAIAR